MKNMNWFKKAQEDILPEEVEYDPEWGEHHGPVSMKRDYWNYGQPGYNSYSPPMPMPTVLYHVTPFADKISEEGFKTFTDPEKQTFGGHGEYISLTSLKNAKMYQEGLKDFIRTANLPTDAKKIMNFLKEYFIPKWNISNGWLENIETQALRLAEKDADYQMNKKGIDEFLLEALFSDLGTAHIYSKGDKRFPMILFSKNVANRFRGMDPNNVKIIEAETYPQKWHSGVNIFDKDMSDKYTYNKSENEWRVWNPTNIKVLKILD